MDEINIKYVDRFKLVEIHFLKYLQWKEKIDNIVNNMKNYIFIIYTK